MKIQINENWFDVMDYYRPHGFTELPPTPTMSGHDIMARSGSDSDYELIEVDERGEFLRAIKNHSAAIPLKDGMRFATFPPASPARN